MDGTLLNEELTITNRTVDAILNAQNAGIEFAVATGRAFNSGYPIMKERGIASPFISLNGARLFNEKQELQFSRKIEQKDLEELIQIIEHHNVQSQLVTQKGTYSNNSIDDHIRAYKQTFKNINPSITEDTVTNYVRNHLKRNEIQQVDGYAFIVENPDIQLLKIFLGSATDQSSLEKIEQIIAQNLPDLIVTSASTGNLEINHVQANKGQAVADLVKMRGYSRDQVITIGDNINDIPMLKWATHSYAVDNGHQLAKKAARYPAPSHEENAVAKIIENVLSRGNFVL